MLTRTNAASPGGLIRASVLIDGTAQPLYRSLNGELWVAGTPGTAYTLRVAAQSHGRLEVITTVDGRNTLKDEPGDAHANRGLVFTGSAEFTGWRQNDAETRAFVFADPAASIAAQATGTTADLGVIGFAAYRERDRNPYLRSMPLAAPGGEVTRSVTFSTTSKSASLGTGMGETISDRVGRTSFERDGEPDIIVIRYDTEAALRERGIIGPATPNAFPGAGTGYEKYQAVR